ncbi:MAG: hypothetical protein ACRC1K_12715 [Planctomycetia bacterium]
MPCLSGAAPGSASATRPAEHPATAPHHRRPHPPRPAPGSPADGPLHRRRRPGTRIGRARRRRTTQLTRTGRRGAWGVK